MDLQLSKLSLLLNKIIFPEKHIHQRMPRRHGNQYPWVPTFLQVINLGALFWDTMYFQEFVDINFRQHYYSSKFRDITVIAKSLNLKSMYWFIPSYK